MDYGGTDGHGTYGQLTTGEGGGLICHECGAERAFLGRHVRVHGMTAAQYREAHGLGRSTSLASPDLLGRWSENAAGRVGSAEWERFAAARDPDTAREESAQVWREETPRPAVMERLRLRALAASRSRQGRECDVDDCGRPHAAHGLCRTHLGRLQRTGDVQAHKPVRPRKGGPQKK